MKNPPEQYETIPVEFKWTIQDEAIHRGGNFADAKAVEYKMLIHEEGMSFHAILKNAYQEGFLHGFEHKFDNTNYEEKEDGKR